MNTYGKPASNPHPNYDLSCNDFSYKLPICQVSLREFSITPSPMVFKILILENHRNILFGRIYYIVAYTCDSEYTLSSDTTMDTKTTLKRANFLTSVGGIIALATGTLPIPAARADGRAPDETAAYEGADSRVIPTTSQAAPPILTPEQYEQDFDVFWEAIRDNYAYFDQKTTDWIQVRNLYRPQVKNITARAPFVTLLETMLEELYDFHANLNTNLASSPRLVPTGADLWAEWRGSKAILTEVRPGSSAEHAGLVTGTEIVAINGVEVAKAVQERLGKSLRKADNAARDWALRVLLAGRHNEERQLQVRIDRAGAVKTVDAGNPETRTNSPSTPVEHRRIGPGAAIGYIRFNNSLGSQDTIQAYDAALAELKDTQGLILDLRDTPSGGNTTVARGIMGRLIEHDGFYQKHVLPAEERESGVRRSWMEIVSPRGPFRYSAPIVVLVDHWTGSMGEGIAIGLDGLKRGKLAGTHMARLLGATSQYELSQTGIRVSFPTEKLYHVNGTPREAIVPAVLVDLLVPDARKSQDPILDAGLKALSKH